MANSRYFVAFSGYSFSPRILFAAIESDQTVRGTDLRHSIYAPMTVAPDDTRLEDLALPWGLVARLELIGVRTLKQFRVLLGMPDKTRAQIVTMLRRSPLRKTNRPGLA
jgi:hypothetical protein